MPATERLQWVLIARIHAAGVDDFRRYEDLVLPLMSEYDGRLESRYRGAGGCFEMHVVSFPSTAALDAYRAEPRRQAAAHLLVSSQATIELVPVETIR